MRVSQRRELPHLHVWKEKKKKRGSEESILEDEEVGMEKEVEKEDEKEEEGRSRYPMCRIFTGLVE